MPRPACSHAREFVTYTFNIKVRVFEVPSLGKKMVYSSSHVNERI